MTPLRLGRPFRAAPARASSTSPLAPYAGKRPLRARFWLRFAVETFGRRRVAALVRSRMVAERLYAVDGLECIPAAGVFVLAVNHFSGRPAFDTAAAVLLALGQARPDALDAMTIVVGQRRPNVKPGLRGWPVHAVRRALDSVFRRWQSHVVRIPLKNADPSPVGLRDWRARAAPAFVFPEGRAGLAFGGIRRGAGRWLAALGLPVVPVGVWWKYGEGWTVRFGEPLDWTRRVDLLDVQLGLAMATLLPEPLAAAWQPDLDRWRAAHHTR